LLESCLEEFEELKKLLADAKTKANALTKENEKKWANIYIKIMEKAIERGVISFESEKENFISMIKYKMI